ncbi:MULTISPECIES: hypothetical protein [unclassified Burkholderia]|nr:MULTISPECIES: hypothetical protein [unclassified Burkholderia]
MKKYLSARIFAALLRASSSPAAFVLLSDARCVPRAAVVACRTPVWKRG